MVGGVGSRVGSLKISLIVFSTVVHREMTYPVLRPFCLLARLRPSEQAVLVVDRL